MSIVNRTFKLNIANFNYYLIHAQSVKRKVHPQLLLKKVERFVLSQEDHMIENFTLKQSIMPRLWNSYVAKFSSEKSNYIMKMKKNFKES